MFILFTRKGDQNGGTKEEMLCQHAVRAHTYFRLRRRSSAQTRSRKRREERCRFKNRESVTHRKSFAAVAAAAAAEAEAARHRTKKGEVGTRSFEKRASSHCFFCAQVAFFFRRRERKRKRKRERESACSYNRENRTLNELEIS